MKNKRIILHIDMDYFFAQIEERENPRFKGRPVVVGANPKKGKGRGVVSTCNYHARKYKIKSGMPISRAYKLCPKAVFLPVNMSFYKKVSSSIFKNIEKKHKKIEKISLDEAYVDLTSSVKSFKKAEEIGEKIKTEIFKKEKLTCSVGIAENKMLAKIACELVKPNGIKVISPSSSIKVISKLDIDIIPGIGPKTKKKIEEYLEKENPKVSDLRKIRKKKLIHMFGKRGSDFYHRARAIDNSPVKKKKTKSIGKEITFQKDTRDPQKITSCFRALVFSVAKTLKEKNIPQKGIVVVCRFDDFQTYTKQISFEKNYYSRDFLYKKSIPLLLHFLVKGGKKIRLIGFRVIVSD